LRVPSDALPDDPEMLKAMLLAERCESKRLRQIIRELQRHRFGRRAETLPEEQMLLGLEDVEQVAASDAWAFRRRRLPWRSSLPQTTAAS
jgi:transposase